jgi:hypothetical protein
MNVVVRSDLPPDQLIGAVRRSIRQTDPTVVMNGVRTMNDVVRDTLQLERRSNWLGPEYHRQDQPGKCTPGWRAEANRARGISDAHSSSQSGRG